MEGGKRVGFMFLAEATLGKEHHITRDDSSLKHAPPGFDSIIAKVRSLDEISMPDQYLPRSVGVWRAGPSQGHDDED